MKTNVDRMQQVTVWLGVACLGLVPLGPLSAQEPKLRATIQTPKHGMGFVAFSPDGNTLASIDQLNGEAKLWDVASGKNIATLKVGKAGRSLAFSPDGKTLATAAADIILWDVATGKIKARFPGVYPMALSRDGKRIAFFNEKGIQVGDVASGKIILARGEYTELIDAMSMTFSPDGKTLAVGGGFRTKVKLWDVSSDKESVTFLDNRVAWSLAYSPDGKTLASGNGDTIKLWDVDSCKNTATLKGHTGLVMSVSFSPDGKTLASAAPAWGDNYGEVKLWDVASGKNTATFGSVKNSSTVSVAFSPDGKTLATGGGGGGNSDGTIKLWDMPAAKKADK